MNRLQEIILTLEEISRNPANSVKAVMNETGKKAIGCFPYYVPEEIIYAGGMLPIGLWGAQTEFKLSDKYLQSFCCSMIRANLELGIKGIYDFMSAIIIPTYCDTLKCICENWKAAVPSTYLIPIVYPQNRNIAAGKEYLIQEFKRVQTELENIAGRKITEEDLQHSITVYEEYRKTMREFTSLVSQYPITLNAKTRHLIIKAALFSDKKIFTAKLEDLITELKALPREDFNGLKVVITGILAEPEVLLDTFVQNNIVFAADDLAQESRQFRTDIHPGDSALEMLALKMADQRCSLLYDETKSRGKLLIDLVKENDADGVVVSMMKFCDPEEFDYPIYKKELEEANIPMLYLEIEQQMESVEQIRTRIQSFSEMILDC